MAHSNLSCSFCGKRQEDVGKLIAGPVAYICNECVGLCNDIIAEEAEVKDVDTAARGSGKHIASQPEDALSVLTFVQQHCDGRPVDSVTIGEIVTKRRALNPARIALAQEHRDRVERERIAAREEQARRGFLYVNLDNLCADDYEVRRARAAAQRLKVDRQWCIQHHALPILFGEHGTDYTVVVSSQPAPGEQYGAVFHARVRAGLAPGEEPFGIRYCDPDAFDRAIARIFDDESDADADDRLRDTQHRIPDDALERELGVLGKPHQR